MTGNAANLVPVTVIYRCGHESNLTAYAETVDALKASMGSWLCTPCRLRAPERKVGRGRGSIPLISRLQA